MKAIHIKFIGGILLLCFINSVWAQPIDPWLADGLNRQIQQNRNNAQGANRGPSAAEVRAWHERERKIQAEITELRATPFYMAIVFNFSNNKIMSAGGYYTEKRAIEEALTHCTSSNCRVLSTFSNACGVLTYPKRGVQSINDIFIGIDTDDNKAAAKSIKACEAKNGSGQCLYSSIKTKNGTAFCAGYDYSVYGQQ